MFGLFDGIFDFNNDGKIDAMEQAVGFNMLDNLMNEENNLDIDTDFDFEFNDEE